ncbi:dNTP triphosphohydrolase [Candidatus Gracilibacteria bacterium]|nr:dNTP triphosphohydrolase [Candidatus Gracilibacteria bacterium]MCF7819692.1 dNTP triphosphohydrolase [Candidatus Gracilibacteria bacterium]
MSKKTLDGTAFAERFDQGLASYAQRNADSRGREYPEIPDPERLPFQRDRDRIIHTKAFRRLKGKMQVVPPSKGDHFRNRLSHTLEVVQIARDLARNLQLNEDLAEAIALAHDLGHPPFGHSGEETLDSKMKEHGSRFEHNAQSLRIVEVFESRYQDFPGLNLTYEVREGIQKHETFFDRPEEGRIIHWPHMEAQLVDVSDEIAYLSADLEDGLRGDFFSLEDLSSLDLVHEAITTLEPKERKDRSALIRRIIRHLLLQIVQDTQENIQRFHIQTLQDVQNCSHRIVAFEKDFFKKFRSLKQFLWDRYYLSPVVRTSAEKGQKIIVELFDYFLSHPDQLPDRFMQEENLHRRVCDYIAGMTDEFAEKMYFDTITSKKGVIF